MKLINKYLILIFIIATLLMLIFPISVSASGTNSQITPIASSADTDTYVNNATYATAQGAATGTVSTATNTTAIIGQQKPANYQINRYSTFFDTSAIPVGSTIVSATLNIFLSSDSSTTDFNITVLSGQPTYPHNPVVAGDYAIANYTSGSCGSVTTAGISVAAYTPITLNSTGLAAITKAGTTKLELVSDRDISQTAPTGNEFVTIFTGDAANIYNRPQLVVTYTPPNVGNYSLYENIINGQDTDSQHIYGVNWSAEQFKSENFAHTVNQIWLYIKKVGSPSTVTVSIKGVDANFLPTGNDLSSGTLNGNNFSTSYTWQQFTLDGFDLSPSMQYSIVVRAVAGDASNYVLWGRESTGLQDNFLGVGFYSTNSGTNWTSDSPADYMYQIWATSDLQVVSASVFDHYIITGDMLLVAEIINTYPPYYPTGVAGRYFSLELVDTDGSTVLASTPISDWEDRPASIYISATMAATLTSGTAYYVRLQGFVDGSPYSQYTLQPNDWQGSNLAYLDQTVMQIANDMTTYYSGTAFTTYISGKGQIFNEQGGVIFDNGVTSLKYVRPDLFSAVTTGIVNPAPTITNSFDTSGNTWDINVGPQASKLLTDTANASGFPSGRDLGGILMAVIYVVVAVFMVAKGHASAGIAIAFPLLGLAALLHLIAGQIIVALCVIFVGLFVWSFWLTRT